MTHKDTERLTMPGEPPTDEDLRHEAELTRQELAQTVAALGAKADVKTRVREAAHEKTVALRERGDELAAKLPEPVAAKVRPVIDTASRRPGASIAAVLAFLVLLRMLLRRRHANS